MKYFFFIFPICLLFIIYAWQNIEVMKIKLNFRKQVMATEELAKRNDRLVYEIEKMRRIKNIDQFSKARGLKEISGENIEIISIKKGDE